MNLGKYVREASGRKGQISIINCVNEFTPSHAALPSTDFNVVSVKII